MTKEEAEVVREVFRRFLDGETAGAIAKDLRARHHPPSRSKPSPGTWRSRRWRSSTSPADDAAQLAESNRHDPRLTGANTSTWREEVVSA